MERTVDSTLAPLDRLVGTWSTEATHPAFPGVVVRGTADVEWLEGERFLIHRTRTDHPDFPDAICIIGDMARDRVDGGGSHARTPSSWQMHYFDSRGVHRIYEMTLRGGQWKLWRDSLDPFAQRFTGRFSEDGKTITGAWELAEDGSSWKTDFELAYTKLG